MTTIPVTPGLDSLSFLTGQKLQDRERVVTSRSSGLAQSCLLPLVRCNAQGSGAEKGGIWDNVGKRRGRWPIPGMGEGRRGSASDPLLPLSLSERRRQLQEAAAKMGDPFKDMVAVASKRLQQYFDSNSLKSGTEQENGSNSRHKSDWEMWQEVIAQVEEREIMLSALRAQVEDAVEAEEFRDAASLQQAIKELERHDDMANVFRLLQEALENENYSYAAHLRDEAGAGLVGWWVARSAVENDKDPFGRLVRISHSQGRLVARAYTAKQIVAAAEGQTVFEVFVTEDNIARLPDGFISRTGTSSESFSLSSSSPEGGLQFRKQAAFWKRPEMSRPALSLLSGANTSAARIQEAIAALAKEKDRVSRNKDATPEKKDKDGAPEGGALPLLPPSGEKPEGEDDAVSKIISFFKERMPDVQLKVFQVGPVSGDEKQAGEKDLPKIVEDMLELLRKEKSRSKDSKDNDDPKGAKDSASSAGLGVEGQEDTKATPKTSPTADSGPPAGKVVPGTFLGPSASRSGVPSGRDPGSARRGGRRDKAGGGWGMEDTSNADNSDEQGLPVRVVVGGVLPVQGAGRGMGEATPPVRVPASIEMRDRDHFRFVVCPDEKEAAATKEGAEGEGEKPRLMRSRTLTRQQAAEAALNLMPNDVAGVLFNTDRSSRRAASQDKDLAHLIRSAVARVQRQAQGLPRVADFERIQTDGANNDPLSGLYVGAFGPFTSEVVQLRRRFGRWEDDEVEEQREAAIRPDGTAVGLDSDAPRTDIGAGSVLKGEEDNSRARQKEAKMMGAPAYEYVEAVKLTGDLHVPSGQVAFRARISRNHRLSSAGIFPEELGVVARYPGEGRLAEAGFEKPRWVDGEIVLLDSKAVGFTNGAELGFVYSSSERHFLILFNRLKLA